VSKQHLNVALKTAIVQSGKKQKQIARLARMSDARLSHIVRYRIEPHDDERKLIAKAVGRPVDELFPEHVGV
jgi:transcriptional regulator with XRE-family HTH domain